MTPSPDAQVTLYLAAERALLDARASYMEAWQAVLAARASIRIARRVKR